MNIIILLLDSGEQMSFGINPDLLRGQKFGCLIFSEVYIVGI